jgi:hypothetical protein
MYYEIMLILCNPCESSHEQSIWRRRRRRRRRRVNWNICLGWWRQECNSGKRVFSYDEMTESRVVMDKGEGFF